jgi:hypothetical protein
MNWMYEQIGMLAIMPEAVSGVAAAVAGALTAFWVNRWIGDVPRTVRKEASTQEIQTSNQPPNTL